MFADIKIGSIIKIHNRPYEIIKLSYSRDRSRILLDMCDVFTDQKIIDIISMKSNIEIITPDIKKVDVLGLDNNIITVMFNDNKISEIFIKNNTYYTEIKKLLDDYKNVMAYLLSYNDEYKIIGIE